MKKEMDSRITVSELYDLLKNEIQIGNGNKFITINEYYIEKPIISDFEVDEFSIGYNGIYHDDVIYTGPEIEKQQIDKEKWNLENKSIIDEINKNMELQKVKYQDNIYNLYCNYIVKHLNALKTLNLPLEEYDKKTMISEINKIKSSETTTNDTSYFDYILNEIENFNI